MFILRFGKVVKTFLMVSHLILFSTIVNISLGKSQDTCLGVVHTTTLWRPFWSPRYLDCVPEKGDTQVLMGHVPLTPCIPHSLARRDHNQSESMLALTEDRIVLTCRSVPGSSFLHQASTLLAIFNLAVLLRTWWCSVCAELIKEAA